MSRLDEENLTEEDREQRVQRTLQGLPRLAAMEQQHNAYMDALQEQIESTAEESSSNEQTSTICRHGITETSFIVVVILLLLLVLVTSNFTGTIILIDENKARWPTRR